MLVYRVGVYGYLYNGSGIDALVDLCVGLAVFVPMEIYMLV